MVESEGFVGPYFVKKGQLSWEAREAEMSGGTKRKAASLEVQTGSEAGYRCLRGLMIAYKDGLVRHGNLGCGYPSVRRRCLRDHRAVGRHSEWRKETSLTHVKRIGAPS